VAMRLSYAAILFLVACASNYTETSAIPDCLRLLDPPPQVKGWVNTPNMRRNKQLADVMRSHRHDVKPMAAGSRVMVGVLFVGWVVALNVVLA